MKILITGGCGFIGCNAAQRFLQTGHAVVVIDDLSRVKDGVARLYQWVTANREVFAERAATT